MMLREDGDTLHLLSAVSPEWIGASKQIRVERAPTIFGPLDFTLSMSTANRAVLRLSAHWQKPPRTVVLHVPWFLQVDTATADGASLAVHNDALEIPSGTTTVTLLWHRRAEASAMSYLKTVASYKAEYRRRYQQLLATGEIAHHSDTWHVPER
jgi:hypothetical protein